MEMVQIYQIWLIRFCQYLLPPHSMLHHHSYTDSCPSRLCFSSQQIQTVLHLMVTSCLNSNGISFELISTLPCHTILSAFITGNISSNSSFAIQTTETYIHGINVGGSNTMQLQQQHDYIKEIIVCSNQMLMPKYMQDRIICTLLLNGSICYKIILSFMDLSQLCCDQWQANT